MAKAKKRASQARRRRPASQRTRAIERRSSADVVPTKCQQIAPRRTFPQPCHWRYLDAVVEALETDGNVSNRAIARRMGVRHETITRWTRQHPDIRAWVGQRLETVSNDRHAHIVNRCVNLALRGSIDHAKLYFQVTGRLGSMAGHGSGADGVAVNNAVHTGPQVIYIAVPRPGDEPVSCSQQYIADRTRGT
jgi:hypothetical protein